MDRRTNEPPSRCRAPRDGALHHVHQQHRPSCRPLRGRGARNVSQSRTKKPTPSFPTADQVEQVISQLQTLVSTGEAEKVDGELKRLLQALGLDPASPAGKWS